MKNIIIIICLLFKFQNASAEIYKYIDENGEINMTDDINKIPKKHRDERKRTTKFRLINNSIFLPATIIYKGKSVNLEMVLDTGCTITAIAPEVANMLGIKNDNEAIKGTVTVAGGVTKNAFIVNSDSIIVGTKKVINSKLIISPGDKEGSHNLLGLSFLENHPHTIDMKNKIITWH